VNDIQHQFRLRAVSALVCLAGCLFSVDQNLKAPRTLVPAAQVKTDYIGGFGITEIVLVQFSHERILCDGDFRPGALDAELAEDVLNRPPNLCPVYGKRFGLNLDKDCAGRLFF